MATYVENEKESANIGFTPVGFYYYLIPLAKVNSANYLGWVDTIQSVTYNPFIEEEDILRVIDCPFNTDKYGRPDNGVPKCYRIESDNIITKTLGTNKLFNTKEENGNYDPKLQMFPFRYFMVTDYINPPLLLKPQLFKNVNNNQIEIKVTTAPLSMQAKYNISAVGYKGDYVGNLEGLNSSNSLMLPVTSSIYSQFISSSMTSFTQGNINAMLENDLSLHQGLQNNALNYMINKHNIVTNGVLDTVGNALTGINGAVGSIAGGAAGGPAGMAVGAVAGAGQAIGGLARAGVSAYKAYSNYQFNERQGQLVQNQLNEKAQLTEYEINTMAQARISDMLNTPNSIKTSGNDTLFSMALSRKKVDIIEYKPKDEVLERVDQYFKKYGYRYNKYDKLGEHMNSRKYYNFVKTNSCNIASAKVPLIHMNEIKEIFNRGTTIWHIDNGAEVGNYNVDNVEI